MDIQQQLSALRSLLHGEPRGAAWRELCHLLDAIEDEAALGVALDYAQGLLEGWPDALRVAPVHWWRQLSTRQGAMRWELVRGLDLKNFTAQDIRLLSAWTEPRLRHLRLQPGQGLAELALLLEHLSHSPLARRLERLDLSGSQLRDTHLRHLAQGRWPALHSLELSRNALTDRGLDAFSIPAHFPSLEALHLASNAVTGQGLLRLAQRASLPSLRTLDLRGAQWSGPELEALLLSGLGQRLTRLRCDLSRLEGVRPRALERLVPLLVDEAGVISLQLPALGDALIELLAHWPGRGRVRHLDLSNNRLSAAGAAALAELEGLDQLHTLDLARNQLHDEGAAALTRAPWWPRLRHLRLGLNHIQSQGAAALAQALPPSLEILDLSHNKIGRRGAEALGQHAHGLRRLDLSSNGLGEGGLWALLRGPAAPSWGTLRVPMPQAPRSWALALGTRAFLSGLGALDPDKPQTHPLEGRHLGDEALAPLLRAPFVAELRALDLKESRLGPPTCRALAQAPCHLHRLDLSRNALGDEGMEALAQAPWLAQVETLALGYARISSLGLALLLDAPLERLEALHLPYNLLDDEGMALLARARLPRLRYLDLAHNQASPQGLARLAQAPWYAGLRHLDLSGMQAPAVTAGAQPAPRLTQDKPTPALELGEPEERRKARKKSQEPRDAVTERVQERQEKRKQQRALQSQRDKQRSKQRRGARRDKRGAD